MNLYSASLKRLLDDLGAGVTTQTVSRPSGDGITAAVTRAAADSVTGRIIRMTDPKFQALAAALPHLTADWWWIGDTDQDIRIDDRLGAGDYSFGVQAVDDTWPGYAVAALKRLR